MTTNILRYFGVGKESVYGTLVPPKAFFDITGASLDSPSDPFITYEGGIGRMPARIIPGAYVPSGNVEYGVDITRLAYMLNLLLGDNTTLETNINDVVDEELVFAPDHTILFSPVVFDHAEKPIRVYNSVPELVGESDPLDTGLIKGLGIWLGHDIGRVVQSDYSGPVFKRFVNLLGTHTINYSYGRYEHTLRPVLGNVMPSFSAYLGKDIFEHAFQGCVARQMELSVEQELLMATLDMQAQKDSKLSIRALADLGLNLCYGERPKAFSSVKFKIAGSDVSAYTRSLSLAMNNNGGTEENVALNSRFPYAGTAGPLEISGSTAIQFENTSYKEKFWGNATAPTKDDPTFVEMEITISAGMWGSAVITLPRCYLHIVNIQPSGRERLVQDVSFKALYSCDDEEIITAVVYNSNRWHDPSA